MTEIKDVDVFKKGEWSKSSEIVSPTIGQFKKFLAERYLALYGPRRLVSFIQRCEASGPWAEPITVWEKDKNGRSKKRRYSKLEYELFQLQKIHRSHLRLSPAKLERYQELQITMSPKAMAKSDDELLDLTLKWIESLVPASEMSREKSI